MTGNSPDLFPFIPGFNVEADDQARLRAAAAEAAAATPPRRHCPADPL